LGDKKLGTWSLSQDLIHAKRFFERLNCEIVTNFFSADVIYSPWHDLILRRDYYCLFRLLKKIKKTRIITVISNDVSQHAHPHLNKLSNIADTIIVPSRRLYDFFAGKNWYINLTHIPFYVDKQYFNRKKESRLEICHSLDIDPEAIGNKLLIGSFQRDSLGDNLKKLKWQKNPDLLIKILKQFHRDEILLVLAGPRRHYVINQCRKHDIPYLFYGDEMYIDSDKDDLGVNNIEHHRMSLLYNLIDCYTVTSKSEGGPKAVLEAAMTKTFIVSTDVGLAPDILHGDLLYDESEPEKLVNFIKKVMSDEKLKKEYINYNFNMVNSALDESSLIEKYTSLVH
jgi:glycosyltransferase involved in cell wall biosynthesis